MQPADALPGLGPLDDLVAGGGSAGPGPPVDLDVAPEGGEEQLGGDPATPLPDEPALSCTPRSCRLTVDAELLFQDREFMAGFVTAAVETSF